MRDHSEAGPDADRAASSRIRTRPRPLPGLYTELLWRIGQPVDPLPSLALNLSHVAGLTVDIARAGLASLKTSTINVVTDTLAQVTLAALPSDTTVLLDGQPTGPSVAVRVNTPSR